MLSYLPSFPYPPPAEGYWGPQTSTINWCEEDYYATIYSAEIVNTLTNLLFVFLAYKGISSCIRYSHPPVFLIGFLGYLSIGLGSMLFHSTLKYPMQLIDELSMIYTSCVLVYALFSYSLSPLFRTLLSLSLTTLAIFITAYYHFLQDPKFHQDAFALLSVLVAGRSIWLMEFHVRLGSIMIKRGAGVTIAEQKRREEKVRLMLKTMWAMFGTGLGAMAIGFGLWKVDTRFCGTLRGWRREIGLPWGLLLEFHGWWHLFTGIAGYFNLTRILWLRYCLDGKQDEVKMVWPSFFTSLPVVVKVEDERKKAN